MPLKSNTGIRIYDNTIANNANFFKGSMNLQNLEFDPLITGYAFIVWTKIPSWVEKEYPGFKAMTQKNFLAFSGLDDIELQTSQLQFGFNANEYNAASGIQKNNTTFNLRHAELSGSPIKNMYQFWVTGIRDPETGIATYPKAYNLEYAAKNHTGELMYIVTRPDANNVDKKNIEFAAYYTNVFPKKIALGHLNYEQGQHDDQTIDMPFNGNLHISPQVDEYAIELLRTTYSFRTESMFDPKDDKAGGNKLPDYYSTGTTGSGNGDLTVI